MALDYCETAERGLMVEPAWDIIGFADRAYVIAVSRGDDDAALAEVMRLGLPLKFDGAYVTAPQEWRPSVRRALLEAA